MCKRQHDISLCIIARKHWLVIWARFLSLARSKLRLCSANHRAGYFSNLACDWLSIVWAYSEKGTENGPWMALHKGGDWWMNTLSRARCVYSFTNPHVPFRFYIIPLHLNSSNIISIYNSQPAVGFIRQWLIWCFESHARAGWSCDFRSTWCGSKQRLSFCPTFCQSIQRHDADTVYRRTLRCHTS